MAQTHHLKFVIKGNTFPTNVGIKCSPQQTYGVSEEAPEEFKINHTLIGQNGYLYRFDDQPGPVPFRQKKYSSVVGETIDVVENLPTIFREQFEKDPTLFRRRKGRLTDFMDKNGWMNKVYKMSGFERTDKAREASNKDRERRIASLTRKKVYQNPVALSPKQNLPALSLLGQKTRIRKKRLDFLKANKEELKIQRELQKSQDKFVEAEAMTNKMASTLNDKDWRSTMTTIRDRYNRSEISSRMNMTINLEKIHKLEGIIENQEDELDKWFNTTRNSNSKRWAQKKPKKMMTNSSEEPMND